MFWMRLGAARLIDEDKNVQGNRAVYEKTG
jgi:hypothetical protein